MRNWYFCFSRGASGGKTQCSATAEGMTGNSCVGGSASIVHSAGRFVAGGRGVISSG